MKRFLWHWTAVVLTAWLVAVPCPTAGADVPRRSAAVEAAIERFYIHQLGGIDLATEIVFPKTTDQRLKEGLAYAGFVYALGKDCAMVITLGHSEPVIQIIDKGVQAALVVDLLMPDVGSAVTLTEISLDASTALDGGQSVGATAVRAGRDYAASVAVGSVPVLRTAVAFHKIQTANQQHRQFIDELIARNKSLLAIGALSEAVIDLRRQIDGAPLRSERKREEYHRTLNRLLQRYARWLAYKDAVIHTQRHLIDGFGGDLQNLFSQLDGTYGQGTIRDNSLITRDYGIGRAIDRFVVNAVGWPVMEREVLARAREVSGALHDPARQVKTVLDRHRPLLENVRRAYVKYDPSTGGGAPVAAYPAICMGSGGAVLFFADPAAATGAGAAVPQGTRLPPFVHQPPVRGPDIDPDYEMCSLVSAAAAPGPGRIVIAVVDSSGSMHQTDPRRLRIAALSLMIDTLDDTASLGIVDFASRATVLARPAALGPLDGPERRRLRDVVARIGAAGGTNIRDGLTRAAELLTEAGEQGIVVLLTDGIDRTWSGEARMLPEGVPAHTIAFSDESDMDGLARLAAHTGGIAEIARTADELSRVVTALFGAALDEEVLLVRESPITQGQRLFFDVPVESGHGLLVAQVSWPGSNVDLTLEDPRGRQYPIAKAVAGGYGVEAATYDIIRIADPIAGKWRAHLHGVSLPPGGETCLLRVTARQSANPTRWQVSAPVPEVNEPVAVTLDGPADVQWQQAQVRTWRPDGTHREVSHPLGGLSSLLAARGAIEVFTFTPERPGLYRVQITAVGRSADGQEVQRAFERTIRVEVPGQGVRHRRDIDPFIRRMQSR